jgi:polyribonucleotide nucleotidyltransferase
MATVCAGSLALFDAGVPISQSAAGISIGLIKEEEKYKLLVDITGLEDNYGDMDFKVAGTKDGITAIQLDLKIPGIDCSLIKEALYLAKQARLYILKKMAKVISSPRQNLSIYAPRILKMAISPSKIKDVIGPNGRIIKNIIDTTGVKIDISDDGNLIIYGPDEEATNQAKEMIEYLTQEVEIGKIYLGKVTRIARFGAFVEIFPGKEGLVHISQLADYRVKRVEDVVKEGDEILVKVTAIDELGRIVLSRKALPRKK